MERFELSKLGSVGYISQIDMRPYEIPPSALSNIFNIRMDNGAAEMAKGWYSLGDLAAAQEIHAIYYNISQGATWWLFFSDVGIHSWDSVSEHNVTRASGAYTGTYPDNVWITDNFNGYVIATNNTDAPQVQVADPLLPSTQFKDFTNWPANTTAKLVVAYKNYVVAFNITEPTGNFSNMVWWSDESLDGLPPTDWDYTNPDNRSGRSSLGTDSGAIVAAKKLRDSIYIYCENGVFRMDFVGGNNIFRFTEVFKNTGAYGPRCVEEIEGKHFVVTPNDIITHDGNQLVSVGDMRVNKEVFNTLSFEQTNVITVNAYPKHEEIWIMFNSTPDDTYPDKAYVFNYRDATWSIRNIPNTRQVKLMPIVRELNSVGNIFSYQDACILDPVNTDCLVDVGGPKPDTNYTVDNYAKFNETSYDSAIEALGDLELYGVGGDNNYTVYRMDIGYEYPDAKVDWDNTLVEKEDINVTNDETTQMMVSVYPKIFGEFPLDIYVGGMTTTEGAINWKGPFKFLPATDYKVSSRVRGRRFAIRIRPTGPFPFRLEGLDIVYSQAGMR